MKRQRTNGRLELIRKRVVKYQERTGVSENEFARKARLATSTLHDILHDRNPRLTPKSYRKILHALNPATGDLRYVAMQVIMGLKRRYYSDKEIEQIHAFLTTLIHPFSEHQSKENERRT